MPAARAETTPRLRVAALLSALALAALLFASSVAHAEKLPFKKYTTADGLGHDRVERIVRDSRGFLWFCTGEGLSRFDGYEFKNYTQAEGLPHRRVMNFMETRDGRYFVATYAGVVIFNPLGTPRRWNDLQAAQEAPAGGNEPPMFHVLRPPDARPDRRAWTTMDLLEDRTGRIWVATMGGLYWLERAGGEWIFHRVESEVWPGAGPEFTGLYEDRHGALWIGTNGDLFRLLPDGRVEVVKKKFSARSFIEDRQGRIWTSSQGQGTGLLVFTFPDGQDKPALARNYTTEDGLPTNSWLNDLLETSDGRIFVGVPVGVLEFLPEAGAGKPSFRMLLQTDVVALAEDSGGNIWVGENGTGATKFARRGFTLFDETDFKTPERYAGNMGFKSVFGSSGSEVFFSVDDHLLLRFDGRQFTTLTPFGMKRRSWGWNQIDFRSRTGEWWIGDSQQILRYPNVAFEDLAVTKPMAVYRTGNLLPGKENEENENFRLYEDSRGDVWMSALDSSAIGRWERATERLYTYPPEEYGLFGNMPTAFGEDRGGNLWIGFYFGGLVRYRPGGQFQTFTAQDGMPSGIVNAIYQDGAGRIWIATGANGILRIDNPADEKPRFLNLTTAEGLSSNQAGCFTEDDFGRIYVGTGRGVTRIDPQKGHIKIYGLADGLPRSHIATCGRDATGALWFDQRPMLARFIPEAEEKVLPPPVFIGAVKVNGQPARKLSELGEAAVENLQFTSDQRQVQIDFLALSFGTGETLLYQYRLESADADWSAAGVQRTVNLSLSPGSYRFLVRAVNAEGVASQNPAVVSFSIARPVWQRAWFVALVALVAAAAAYALYRYRVGRLLELERVRTRIATDLHDDIGASLSQIAILSEVVNQRVGGERSPAAEPLTQIAGTSREMVDSMSDIVWAINPARDHLSDLTQRMRRFADDLLGARDISLSFRAPAAERDLRLGADLRREVYLIFKETVNNLAKHARCTRAEVEFRVAGDWLTVCVRDDGEGFDVAAAGNGHPAGMGGHGLQSMRRRAAALGGSYEVESERGRGTTVTLRVPLGGGGRRLREILRGVRLPHK